MGISLLHYMAGDNTDPQWINEYEVSDIPPTVKTRICTPTVLDMRKSRSLFCCLQQTPTGTLLRRSPSQVLSVG
jgi:hypothetical protein